MTLDAGANLRFCGLLFALGHGAVVLLIAASVGLLSDRWVPPKGLAATGNWVPIAVLSALGGINLRAALRAPAGTMVGLVGIKGPVFGRFLQARNAWTVAAVGALLALSFDTLGHAALFAATATGPQL